MHHDPEAGSEYWQPIVSSGTIFCQATQGCLEMRAPCPPQQAIVP